MSEICKLCMHTDIKIKQFPCNACDDAFSMFKSGIEQRLQKARRAGWIQCQREVVTMLQGYMITFKGDGFSMSCSTNDAAIAIAALEYKEPAK